MGAAMTPRGLVKPGFETLEETSESDDDASCVSASSGVSRLTPGDGSWPDRPSFFVEDSASSPLEFVGSCALAERSELPANDSTPLPEDIFGGVVMFHLMAISGRASVSEASIAWLRVFMVFFLQVLITAVMHEYVNGYSAWKICGETRCSEQGPVLNRLLVRLAQCKSGEFELDSIADKKLIDTCWQMPGVHMWFVVMFLWSAQIVREFSSIFGFATSILLAAPSLPAMSRMESRAGGGVKIVGLSWLEKLMFMASIVLPKCAIGVMLWHVGCSFLSLATDITTVVLKMFAIRLILDVDEVFFGALMTVRNKKMVRRSTILHADPRFPASLSEIARLAGVLALASSRWFVDSALTALHRECWSAVTDCDNMCARAFPACERSARPLLNNWLLPGAEMSPPQPR